MIFRNLSRRDFQLVNGGLGRLLLSRPRRVGLLWIVVGSVEGRHAMAHVLPPLWFHEQWCTALAISGQLLAEKPSVCVEQSRERTLVHS
jgi:hypothetical protein